MLFNSIEFLIFFLVVFVTYFLTPQKYKWLLLLIFSYYFYMSWEASYAILILITTSVSYLCSIKIEKSQSKNQKKNYLLASLIINLGILFVFKYFNFFTGSINYLLSNIHIPKLLPSFDLLLPVGISFYTFQTLSYCIDVYKGEKEAEKHFGIFALYVSFFPQLVAGPIERSTRLLPQFYEEKVFDYNRIVNGFKLMGWGFVKKIIIADNLALLVNNVYNNPTEQSGLALGIATVLFAFQIFCDFSGYSDIAIGTAEVLGFDLMQNFKQPYFSKSFSEFWSRWHISLSTWFKDYLYIPLGGNRVPKIRNYFNLFITFLISGLWHGASWTFVIWGGLHGLYLVIEKATKKYRESFYQLTKLNTMPILLNGLKMLFVFTLINFAWIFFRANNISDAFYIINKIFCNLSTNNLPTFIFKDEFIIAILFIVLMEIVHLLNMKFNINIREIISKQIFLLRWAVYVLILISILTFGAFEQNEFIYFQF